MPIHVCLCPLNTKLNYGTALHFGNRFTHVSVVPEFLESRHRNPMCSSSVGISFVDVGKLATEQHNIVTAFFISQHTLQHMHCIAHVALYILHCTLCKAQNASHTLHCMHYIIHFIAHVELHTSDRPHCFAQVASRMLRFRHR